MSSERYCRAKRIVRATGSFIERPENDVAAQLCSLAVNWQVSTPLIRVFSSPCNTWHMWAGSIVFVGRMLITTYYGHESRAYNKRSMLIGLFKNFSIRIVRCLFKFVTIQFKTISGHRLRCHHETMTACGIHTLG